MYLESIMAMDEVKAWLNILSLCDFEAYQHSINTAKITEGYLEEEEKEHARPVTRRASEKESIVKGALLHDIGKAFLPLGLQYSTKKPSPEEREVLKMHPLLGKVVLDGTDQPAEVENIVLMHHAHLNGTGYPQIDSKTLGKDIKVPEYVWIVAYADKIEAMLSSRNYREGKSIQEAWEEIVKMSKEEKLPYGPLAVYKSTILKMDILR